MNNRQKKMYKMKSKTEMQKRARPFVVAIKKLRLFCNNIRWAWSVVGVVGHYIDLMTR